MKIFSIKPLSILTSCLILLSCSDNIKPDSVHTYIKFFKSNHVHYPKIITCDAGNNIQWMGILDSLGTTTMAINYLNENGKIMKRKLVEEVRSEDWFDKGENHAVNTLDKRVIVRAPTYHPYYSKFFEFTDNLQLVSSYPVHYPNKYEHTAMTKSKPISNAEGEYFWAVNLGNHTASLGSHAIRTVDPITGKNNAYLIPPRFFAYEKVEMLELLDYNINQSGLMDFVLAARILKESGRIGQSYTPKFTEGDHQIIYGSLDLNQAEDFTINGSTDGFQYINSFSLNSKVDYKNISLGSHFKTSSDKILVVLQDFLGLTFSNKIVLSEIDPSSDGQASFSNQKEFDLQAPSNIHAMSETDNGYLFCGASRESTKKIPFIMKVDFDLNLQWIKKYPQIPDGSFVSICSTGDNRIGVLGSANPANEVVQSVVLLVDKNGNLN